jgi:hypothetical protein
MNVLINARMKRKTLRCRVRNNPNESARRMAKLERFANGGWRDLASLQKLITTPTNPGIRPFEKWGGQRDSNPQHPEPQSGALPLSYDHQTSRQT